jgi:demethylmenaquinone methyltransferase / 2-methoxy-6-polyprenyl-1,4-benzoquinol methylase
MPSADHLERDRFAQRLFTPLPTRYDRLAELLSFGQNGRWRHEMVDHVIDAQAPRILDVACGTAGVAIQLARRSTAEIVGVDLTEAMLRQGRSNVAAAGLSPRVSLTVGRAQELPFPEASFDALTFTYLLRYVEDPQATLTELARVVRPGGPVASLEFYVPPNPFWRFWWEGYTRLVLPAAGWVSGGREWFEVGRFLGPSISAHYRRYPLEWTLEAWRAAGLEPAGSRVMSLGGGLVIWGSRRR